MKNRLAVFTLLAIASFTMMAGSIIAPVLNLLRDGFGATAASVGLIVTTHALLVAISGPFIGSLIDRIGTKKPLIFGLLLYAAAGGFGLVLKSFWALIISRAILGIGVAAMLNTVMVIIINLYKGDDRNKVMG